MATGPKYSDKRTSCVLVIKDKLHKYIPVKSHDFAVSLTILAMNSRSHADYVISHAFQLKQNLRK